MRIRTIALAGLLAAVAGCASHPYTFDESVTASETVLRRHYTKIESSKGNDNQRVVTSGWQELSEMKDRERWQATVTITRPEDEDDNPSIDIVVMRQNDESDTGYGERSPSNPKWGVATHYQDEELSISNDIGHELRALRGKK